MFNRQNSSSQQSFFEAVADQIAATCGRTRTTRFEVNTLGGGCINDAVTLSFGGDTWFLKYNRKSRNEMLKTEMDGLQILINSETVSVPRPVCQGPYGDHCYLVLEYVRLARCNSGSMRKLGEQLAAMHRHTALEFGWEKDNYIGSTPQHNEQDSNWPAFFQTQRLEPQLLLAAANGHQGTLQDQAKRLVEALPDFYTDYRPEPSLLHGDLWSGNVGADEFNQPWIYDPAVYYGDREADIAMTELFGGFSNDFYSAYQAHYPLDPGYQIRRNLNNLYHVLNHANLFGGSYVIQAEDIISGLLDEIRA